MTREQAILLNLQQILDNGCTAMLYRDADAAYHKIRLAHNVLKEFPPVVIDDYDLDKGILYLTGEADAVAISSLTPEKALGILRTTVDRSVDALDNNQGLAAGQMLRYANRIAHKALLRR